MTRFEEALDYLYNRLPMFQRTGPAAYKHSLGISLALDRLYRHPHRRYATLHIAGTNGKGSVSHMLASVFQAAGYRTGLFTSPHLTDFRERIAWLSAEWLSICREKELLPFKFLFHVWYVARARL